MDCTIEIVLGAKLPKPKIYSMMPSEMEELRKFIGKYLVRGFIQPAKSRIAAPGLFKKKDGSLRMCVNYRGINAICVKNMYSGFRFAIAMQADMRANCSLHRPVFSHGGP